MIMRIDYISPSKLPSRTANSVHVVRMCEAFCSLGHSVRLFAQRSIPDEGVLHEKVESHYGAKLASCSIRSYFRPRDRAANLIIAARSLWDVLRDPPDLIISRNLYAAFVLRFLFPRRLVFETHQLEFGPRKILQRVVMSASRVRTVVISEALKRILFEHHATAFPSVVVLPDGAPAGIQRIAPAEAERRRGDLLGVDGRRFAFRVGYFGHLYQGRGIEVIEALARRHPDVGFFVYGGNDADVRALHERSPVSNLLVKGFVEPARVLDLMQVMDALLMPYQRQVLIDHDPRKDTSRWMSPLKMFEYMASGVPLISSRLPALQEVLRDGHNCLLAEPHDHEEWSRCLQRIREDKSLGERLGSQAHRDYLEFYNWQARSRRMLETDHV